MTFVLELQALGTDAAMETDLILPPCSCCGSCCC